MRRSLLCRSFGLVLFAIAPLLMPAWSGAEEPAVDTVLEGLDNPCGIAIQPGTGHLFVSDSGAGKIIRIAEGQASDVIVGFSTDVYGKGPMYNIGPLGLLFLDKDTLVVGGGDKPDGEEMLRVFKVPEPGAPAKKAEEVESSSKLEATAELKAEGNFYALAKTSDAIYITSNGDDTKGWVVRAKYSGTKVEPIERFLATKEATEVDAPVGITVGPKGHLVVGQMGEINVPGDALVTFYEIEGNSAKKVLNLETKLNDITAISYSTQEKGKAKQLYVLDFSWSDTSKGGLFQLIGGGDESRDSLKEARKIVSLDKPTSMVFGDDGTLYITLLGTAPEGSDKKPGKVVKIAPGL